MKLLIKAVVVVLLPLVLLFSISSLYVFSERFYRQELRKHQVQDVESALQVVRYVKGAGSLPDLSEQEEQHMADVRGIVQRLFKVNIASSTLFLIALFTLGVTDRTALKKTLSAGSLLALVVIVALIALSSLSFTTFFTQFHELLFQNGDWTFPEGSALITFFPESLFMAIFKKIFLTTALVAALLFFVTTLKKFKTFKYKKAL